MRLSETSQKVSKTSLKQCCRQSQSLFVNFFTQSHIKHTLHTISSEYATTVLCLNYNLQFYFYDALSLKPILNWANVCLRTWLEVFGEPSWFLIGQTFLREPSWKYSLKLYSGSKKLRSTCSGNIRPIQRTLPLIGWEQSSPVDEEKIIKMDDSVARFFTRFGRNLFICWLVGGAALSLRPRMR